MPGADDHPGGSKAHTVRDISRTVSTDRQTPVDDPGPDRIGITVSCHAGSGDNGGIRYLLKYGIDQHGLLLRDIKGFDHDIALSEKHLYIFFGDPGDVFFDLAERVDPEEDLLKGRCFFGTDMGQVIYLPVDI